MYEMLTGFRPFRANALAKLLNQIVFATAPPIHTLRADVPEGLEEVVAKAMRKEPEKRYTSCAEFAAELTRVYQEISAGRHEQIDQKEHLAILRRLNFFHAFSHGEIRELLAASEWREYKKGDEIVKEGEMDDHFYVIVNGECVVESNGIAVGSMETGNCFGESSYVSGTKRTATIKANEAVTILRLSATLLEQLSSACQLRFTKVFLASLIRRLQG
jgi:serine/threonine protein kinase